MAEKAWPTEAEIRQWFYSEIRDKKGYPRWIEEIVQQAFAYFAPNATPSSHHVRFEGGPWAGKVVQVERVVGPVFAAGDAIGNHYWLDTKSDPPMYVWDATERDSAPPRDEDRDGSKSADSGRHNAGGES